MGQKYFRLELFTEPSEYEETPLRDRKREFPNIYRDDAKAEFIRDFIALANTARQWGKPAYLLYGLDDAGNLCGITSESLEPFRSRAKSQNLTCVLEEARHQMGQVIGQYVAPLHNRWELHWIEQGECLVAYLLIEPLCPEEAFHVARDLISGRSRLLCIGDCWIRSGESKTEIKRQVLDLRAPGYLQVPYIPPSGWLRYFEALKSSEEMDLAVRKMPYIDLYDRAGNLLEEVVRKWLEESQRRILVLEGPPGSGKSTFICRLVAKLADAGMAAMEEIRRREEFCQPPIWIPVYLRLRELKEPFYQELGKEILLQVNLVGKLWEREPSEPEKLLESRELRWLVCFDGLDELWEEQKIEAFLGAVRSLCRRYPALKVLISTRPLTTIPDDLQSTQIGALSEADILTYLQAFVTSDSEHIYQQVVNGLSDPGSELYALREICTTPLYLEAFASLLSPEVSPAESLSLPPLPEKAEPDQEIRPEEGDSEVEVVDRPQPVQLAEIQLVEGLQAAPNKPLSESIQPSESSRPFEDATPPLTIGWILDRMIRRVWDREASRRSIEYSDLNHWWRATGELALDMDGHRRFVDHRKVMRVYSSKKGLRYVLNLSILCTSIRGIGFSHTLFQHYFGASYLQDDTDQLTYWKSRCTPDFWRSLMTILNQIQYSGGAL